MAGEQHKSESAGRNRYGRGWAERHAAAAEQEQAVRRTGIPARSKEGMVVVGTMNG